MTIVKNIKLLFVLQTAHYKAVLAANLKPTVIETQKFDFDCIFQNRLNSFWTDAPVEKYLIFIYIYRGLNFFVICQER